MYRVVFYCVDRGGAALCRVVLCRVVRRRAAVLLSPSIVSPEGSSSQERREAGHVEFT